MSDFLSQTKMYNYIIYCLLFTYSALSVTYLPPRGVTVHALNRKSVKIEEFPSRCIECPWSPTNPYYNVFRGFRFLGRPSLIRCYSYFTGVWRTGMSTLPAAPPIKYGRVPMLSAVSKISNALSAEWNTKSGAESKALTPSTWHCVYFTSSHISSQ